MKIIIGLGNPDPRYAGTRHNIGFGVVDIIARASNSQFKFEKKFNAEVAKSKFNNKPVILVKACTYVNKTGEAVKKIKNSLKIKPVDIVVIHDDLDIEFGDYKISFGKNSGGHKGVQNVIDNLKTNKFWRMRFGTANRKVTIARSQELKEKKELIKDFVLAEFTSAEKNELKKVIKKSLERLALSL